MSSDCEYFRSRLAKTLFEPTDKAEKRALESHLRECPDCRDELEATRRTVQTLKGWEDQPVPRHFFVYQPEPRWGRGWGAWGWGALATAALVLLATGIVLSQIQVRIEPGVLTIGWQQLPAQQPVWDPEELKTEVMELVDQRLQEQDRQWQSHLQAVSDRVGEESSSRERQLRGSIADLERRQAQQLETRSAALEADYEENLLRLWRVLQARHEKDFGLIREQLQLMTVSDEIHDTRNEALVATLLQMADLRLQD